MEAPREDKTLSQLVAEYGAHPRLIGRWKKELIDGAESLFEGKKSRKQDDEFDQEVLEKKIGRLTIEIDFLKKTGLLTVEEKRLWIDDQHTELSIAAQCRLLSIQRSSYYYRDVPIKPSELQLMRRVDEIYTARSFLGSRKISQELKREGCDVNRKHVQRIMRLLGLASNQPGPNTSKPHPEHIKFPYLLGGVVLVAPLIAWSTDIAYIRLPNGFVYLVAVIDGFSRAWCYPIVSQAAWR